MIQFIIPIYFCCRCFVVCSGQTSLSSSETNQDEKASLSSWLVFVIFFSWLLLPPPPLALFPLNNVKRLLTSFWNRVARVYIRIENVNCFPLLTPPRTRLLRKKANLFFFLLLIYEKKRERGGGYIYFWFSPPPPPTISLLIIWDFLQVWKKWGRASYKLYTSFLVFFPQNLKPMREVAVKRLVLSRSTCGVFRGGGRGNDVIVVMTTGRTSL